MVNFSSLLVNLSKLKDTVEKYRCNKPARQNFLSVSLYSHLLTLFEKNPKKQLLHVLAAFAPY